MEVDISKLYILDTQVNCSDIRPILKDIDPELEIEFIGNKYIITHRGMYFMQVDYGQMDRKYMQEIRKIVWINKNGSMLEEIDKNNEKIEKSHDRDLSNLAECMAKDLRKPLLDAIDYGR